MKYMEYTIKSGKTITAHGVNLRSRAEYYIPADGEFTAKMIDDDAAQALIDSWGGAMLEPVKAEKAA